MGGEIKQVTLTCLGVLCTTAQEQVHQLENANSMLLGVAGYCAKAALMAAV